MLRKKDVEFFAHQSGVSLEIAEREVVLTHALQLLSEQGRLEHFAFKGGTCIRKIHLGATGRFSMDLDFTASRSMDRDDVVLELVESFNQTHHDIAYTLDLGDDKWRITQGGVSLTVQPTYSHEWNSEGGFDVQVSFREKPTLEVVTCPQIAQSYFKALPFQPAAVRCLAQTEVLSEKVRAAYQRGKVRDLHDLYVFSTKVVDQHLLRRLVVLKLWQVGDPFDPAALFQRLEKNEYKWVDLMRLLRNSDKIDPARIIEQCVSRYAFLAEMTDEERELAADAKAHKREELWEKLTESCRAKPGPGEFAAIWRI
jgi:predicted nucleotidyltransferase component of viral defense system